MVGELLRGPLGEVFDYQQLITDVSGSGNNWLRECQIGLFNRFDVFLIRASGQWATGCMACSIMSRLWRPFGKRQRNVTVFSLSSSFTPWEEVSDYSTLHLP